MRCYDGSGVVLWSEIVWFALWALLGLLLALLLGCEGESPSPELDAGDAVEEVVECVPDWSCEELGCGVHPNGCGGEQDCGSCGEER